VIGDPSDDSPPDMPGPPPGLFVLGTVPSIIRCWLNEDFSHGALLYAVICTGSQKSHLDFGLITDLGLTDQLQKSISGSYYIRLPVYLPEALVTRQTLRTTSPAPHLPTLTATFEVFGVNQRYIPERARAIRVFLGSDTLRAHNADVLFSRNLLTLYGDDRTKLSVPFVRPEDDSLFKNIYTANIAPERVELKATATPFTPVEQKISHGITAKGGEGDSIAKSKTPKTEPESNNISASATATDLLTSGGMYIHKQGTPNSTGRIASNENSVHSENADDYHSEPTSNDGTHQEDLAETPHAAAGGLPDSGHSESSGGIWGSWRTGGFSGNDSDVSRDRTLTNSYQRANRGGRSMKVLKPSKPSQRGRSSSTARTGAAYEPPAQRVSGEHRRKSQNTVADYGSSGSIRWESKRTVSGEKAAKDLRPITGASKSSNPIGGASAFAWMNPSKTVATSSKTD
jgi:hypothetical protein